jgi:surface protein
MKNLLLTLTMLLGLSSVTYGQTYCAAGPVSTADSELTGVELPGDTYNISNVDSAAACGTAGVQDFTLTDSADISIGAQYSVAVTMGTCGGSYSGAIAAWIDYNGDGDFDDAGELIGSYSGSPTTTQSWTFNVPLTATLGTTRMRVMQQEGGTSATIAPCNTYNWGSVEDYKIVLTNLNTPSCSTPSNLALSMGTYDAAVSWDGSGSFDHYLVEYDTAGFAPGTGDTMWVYSDTAFVTGLMSATEYDFRVTTICSNDTSSTLSGSAFTQCAGFATPYVESFDNGAPGAYNNASLPLCWEYRNKGVTYPYWYVRDYSTYAHSGSQMLYGYKSSSAPNGTTYGDTVYAASPVIIGLDSATKQLDFYARTSSTSYLGMVTIGVTDANGDNYRSIDTVYATTSYEKYTIYLDVKHGITSGDARVAFAWIYDNTLSPIYDYVYIDDVSITDVPPCPEPTAISVTNVTQGSVDLTWSALTSNFQIEIGPAGFSQGTGFTYSSSSTIFKATGLSQNTEYDAYVMSDCSASGDGVSTWVGPVTFRTECGDQQAPYFTDFEGYASGSSSNPSLPYCWKYAKTGSSTSFYAYNYNSSTYASSGTMSLRYYAYRSTTSTSSAHGDTLAVFSPRIDYLNANDKQVVFKGRGGTSSTAAYDYSLVIGVADTNASLSSIVPIDTVTLTVGTYDDYIVDLVNIPTNASRVVFYMVPAYPDTANGYTYGYNYAYIDDIEIRDIPSCFEPTKLGFVQATPSSAVVNWSGSSGSYYTEYGPAGFVQGTGVLGATADTFMTASNLSSNTAYEFYVSSNCKSSGGGTSIWSGPFAFTTECDAVTTPLTEDFESGASGSYTNASMPECWKYNGGGTTYPYWYVRNYATYANSGSQMIYGYKSSGVPDGVNYGDTSFFASPMIQGLDSATKQVEFYARTSSTSYKGMVLVGVSDAFAHSFRVIDTVFATTSYNKYTVYLDHNSGIVAGDVRVAFAWIWDGSLSPAYDYVYIDDITISDLPACPAPVGLGLNFATQSKAKVSWGSTASSFDVEYGPVGFIQATGNGIMDSTNTNSYTITGLTQNTSYDIYVRSNCSSSGNGTTAWTGPFTFTTECGDQGLPITEGFESTPSGTSSNPSLPSCWAYLKTGTSSSLYAYNYNSTTYANTGAMSLRFYGYASSTSTSSAEGDTLAAFSPRITGLDSNNKQLLFHLTGSTSTSAYYPKKMIIATADSSASKGSIHILDTIDYSTSYQKFVVDLDNVPSGASRVVFMMVPELVSGYTYSYSYAYLDDIEIRPAPSCAEALYVNMDPSYFHIDMSWTGSVSGGSYYLVEYDSTGFTPGTGDTAWVADTAGRISGLMSDATYDVYITNICSATDSSATVGPITVSTLKEPTEVCGGYSLELMDSYGDGWNGNTITVRLQSGDTTFTLATGSSVVYNLGLVYGDTAQFIYNAGGSFQNEVSYKITDSKGVVVYASPTGNYMTPGAVQFAAYCNTVSLCADPIGLSLASATETSVRVNWQSTASAFDIEVVLKDSIQGSGILSTSTTNSTKISNLVADTEYDVYVRANCTASGNGVSNWAGPFTVRTLELPTEVCGAITLTLKDSYGDGWNGNTMTVKYPQGDTTYTFTSGYSLVVPINAAFGDTLAFVWNGGGSYVSECSFEITDALGANVFTSSNGYYMNPGDVQIRTYCNTLPPTCDAAMNIAINTDYFSADMSWDGSVSGGSYYLVEYDTAGFMLGMGDTAWVYDTAATIGGLMSGTDYDFYVTKVCSVSDSSATVGPISASTVAEPTELCGAAQLELIDSYGDGWNGNTMTVRYTGGDSTYTIASGSSLIVPLNIPVGDSVQFIWNGGGSYGSECSFEVSDAQGTVVFSSPQGNAMPKFTSLFGAYCNTVTGPTCVMPSNLVVNSYQTIANLSWTGDTAAAHYVVEYGPAGFSMGSGDTMVVYGTSATMTGLSMNTSYDFYVTAYCSSTSSSAAHGPVQSTMMGLPAGVTYDAKGCQECDSLNVGDFFVMDGDSIEVVDRSRLLAIVAAQGDLTKVCVSHITDMKNALRGATWMNQDIGHWDVSNVTNMNSMFFKCRTFNQDISSWDVSNVTNMIGMFTRCDSFNQSLNVWDVSQVTNMNRMFKEATSFNGRIEKWDVGNVNRMTEMFSSATDFNQDLSDWCVTAFQYNPPVNFGLNSALIASHYPRWGNCPQDFDNVTSLATGAFVNNNGCIDCSALNIGDYFSLNGDTMLVVDRAMLDSLVLLHDDLSKVCVSNITDMKDALRGLRWFNTDIGAWDVSNVTDMSNMFFKAQIFNQDIGNWDVSSVTKMVSMFQVAKVFNQDIGDWDVSNVERFRAMFRNAAVFNQDIGGWDVSSVLNDVQMSSMFRGCASFSQDLSSWCVSNVAAKPSGFDANSALLSTQLPAWGTCPGTSAMVSQDNDPLESDGEEENDASNAVEHAQQVSLFPNPTTGVVQISPVVEGTYQIFNEVGRTIGEGTITETYDFSEQPAGIYMLRLQTENNTQYIKVIKQ